MPDTARPGGSDSGDAPARKSRDFGARGRTANYLQKKSLIRSRQNGRERRNTAATSRDDLRPIIICKRSHERSAVRAARNEPTNHSVSLRPIRLFTFLLLRGYTRPASCSKYAIENEPAERSENGTSPARSFSRILKGAQKKSQNYCNVSVNLERRQRFEFVSKFL